ncbi:uncharacterized protein Z520_01049 [Fonsecaea multimorphosa CBS 102226]|uniref:Uncharacterized protein n=1 Tax=Fonsecaea multimorphosa CBS 102226 TaxID=1442371 RepID=A0A0D2L0M4_9EURO|nr:uncharacterized protein Z520_01049 [Fonsecaea multimorphosa CBS 102226]KIY02584.1 hypothetical protein Z520_01049 [Fonsecaea multimorphosa CBS 102226]OAL31450.1 hypothetical protein AYO22_01042 [Fonsecaea multimorphosa]
MCKVIKYRYTKCFRPEDAGDDYDEYDPKNLCDGGGLEHMKFPCTIEVCDKYEDGIPPYYHEWPGWENEATKCKPTVELCYLPTYCAAHRQATIHYKNLPNPADDNIHTEPEQLPEDFTWHVPRVQWKDPGFRMVDWNPEPRKVPLDQPNVSPKTQTTFNPEHGGVINAYYDAEHWISADGRPIDLLENHYDDPDINDRPVFPREKRPAMPPPEALPPQDDQNSRLQSTQSGLQHTDSQELSPTEPPEPSPTESQEASHPDSQEPSSTDSQGSSHTDSQASSPTNSQASSHTDSQASSPTNSQGSSHTDSQGSSPTNSQGSWHADSQEPSPTNSQQPSTSDSQEPPQPNGSQAQFQYNLSQIAQQALDSMQPAAQLPRSVFGTWRETSKSRRSADSSSSDSSASSSSSSSLSKKRKRGDEQEAVLPISTSPAQLAFPTRTQTPVQPEEPQSSSRERSPSSKDTFPFARSSRLRKLLLEKLSRLNTDIPREALLDVPHDDQHGNLLQQDDDPAWGWVAEVMKQYAEEQEKEWEDELERLGPAEKQKAYADKIEQVWEALITSYESGELRFSPFEYQDSPHPPPPKRRKLNARRAAAPATRTHQMRLRSSGASTATRTHHMNLRPRAPPAPVQPTTAAARAARGRGRAARAGTRGRGIVWRNGAAQSANVVVLVDNSKPRGGSRVQKKKAAASAQRAPAAAQRRSRGRAALRNAATSTATATGPGPMTRSRRAAQGAQLFAGLD